MVERWVGVGWSPPAHFTHTGFEIWSGANFNNSLSPRLVENRLSYSTSIQRGRGDPCVNWLKPPSNSSRRKMVRRLWNTRSCWHWLWPFALVWLQRLGRMETSCLQTPPRQQSSWAATSHHKSIVVVESGEPNQSIRVIARLKRGQAPLSEAPFGRFRQQGLTPF